MRSMFDNITGGKEKKVNFLFPQIIKITVTISFQLFKKFTEEEPKRKLESKEKQEQILVTKSTTHQISW